MGTGASKREENDASEDAIGPPDEDMDKEFQRHLEIKRRQQDLVKKRRKPVQKAVKADASKHAFARARKIIGLADSDEEDNGGRKMFVPVKRRGNEEPDIETLDMLNNTFDSMGLREDHTLFNDSMLPNNAPSAQASENAFLNSSYSSHTRFPQGTSMGRRNSHLLMQQQQAAMRTNRSLKFSWDDRADTDTSTLPVEKEPEEWTYKKTVIDGFDPDKFRKVNKGFSNSNCASVPYVNSISSSLMGSRDPAARMDVPGTVPTYDRTEQQLLSSLEQELGVI